MYWRSNGLKESSELIKSELVYDETELAASDNSFNRLGRREEGVKQKPRARGLPAVDYQGHHRRHAWVVMCVGC